MGVHFELFCHLLHAIILVHHFLESVKGRNALLPARLEAKLAAEVPHSCPKRLGATQHSGARYPVLRSLLAPGYSQAEALIMAKSAAASAKLSCSRSLL